MEFFALYHAPAILFMATFLFFAFKRLRHLLQFYQQEEYDARRFLAFAVTGAQLVDKRFSLAVAFLVLAGLFIPFTEIFVSALFVFFGFRERNPISEGKKRLVMTARAKRIFSMAITISFLLAAVGVTILPKWLEFLAIILVQILPLALCLGNVLLTPYERFVQKKFRADAVRILEQINPHVIGITGSYGKTSVKHILAHILASATPTLATPGSVNTEMGIVRIIREQLKPEHRFFIAEMGAYGIGSIARLCRLTPPSSGILTAVGNAHYERFKSVENVARAKFELYQAVSEKRGEFIVNADQVDPEFIKKYGGDSLITIGEKGAFSLGDQKLTKDGLSFSLMIDGTEEIFEAPLFGTHQISNVALAVMLAHRLGVPVSTIRAALKTTPQIKHRLEVIKKTGQPSIIDDAYNSNPDGFASALSVLELLKQEKDGRAILVTPGMVELGDLHDEKHKELGQKAAEIADIILVVRPERIPTFLEGLRSVKGRVCEVSEWGSFAAAKEWLDGNAKPDDVILYENDLPDLFEAKIKI